MSFITSAEGNFFYQEKRSDPFKWLTCSGVGDIDIPEGDRTPQFCPDPMNSGKFIIDGFIRGDPEAGTYSLEKPLTSVYNFLLQFKCAIVGRVNWVCRGTRKDPRNYEMAVLMHNSEPTRRGILRPARLPGGTDERVMTNMDLQFTTFYTIYRLAIVPQALANTAAANAIYFLPERCEDRCGAARGLCEFGLMGLDRDVGYMYDSEVKKTFDGGANWQVAAVDPFTFGGNILAVVILETVDAERYVVFRGEGVLGAPAEAAYSDDHGNTWTNVFVGAVNNQFITGYDFCSAKLVVCCSGGYIYESENQAQSWTAQESGVETAETLNDICFHSDTVGYAVGNNNAFLYTLNGGGDWASGTGPAALVNLLTCDTNDKGHLFIGTNDARIFRSEDGGETWVEWLDLTAGSVDWLRFDSKASYVGAMIHNDAGGTGHLYRTEDGGATWYELSGMPTNSGLNSGFLCDENHIAIVGEAHGGTTFVAMTMPVVA